MTRPEPPLLDANQVAGLRERFTQHGQDHVFAFWDDLDEAAQARLFEQLQSVDLEQVGELQKLLDADPHQAASPKLEPPETFPLERDEARIQEAAEAVRQGETLLREGLVGVLLVAGGQGSRLGFDGPKGKFPAGPVSGISLFEWHAARLQAGRQRYGAIAPWYIMTSAANDAETQAFFQEHDFFGLGAENVMFFRQAMLPALDKQGKILLQAKDQLFLAPNGHGGTLEALARSGALANAAERGVEFFSYFQVDNPLAKPVDPLFLGLHALEGAQMSSKVVAKRDAGEKVGVLGRIDGEMGCIEYSDLSDELREARDDEGRLVFNAGNIAMHVFERAFLEELTEGGLQLPWHLARKSMKVVGADGQPEQRDGVKFETFIFDALGKAAASVTLEVDRSEEFSPIKNAEGSDSPASCKRDMGELFQSWLEGSGAPTPPTGSDGVPALEIDPRFAEDAEELRARGELKPNERSSGHLYR